MKALTQLQSLSLISNFKNKFNYNYLYAATIIKIANRKDSVITYDSIDKFLSKAILLSSDNISNELYRHILNNNNNINIDKNNNNCFLFAYKVKNKNDGKHKNTIHYHCVLLSKKALSGYVLNGIPIQLNNNSILIKLIEDKKNLNNWLSYIYDKHKIKQIKYGTHGNIKTLERKNKNQCNHIDLLIKYQSIPLKEIYFIILLINKTNKGTYNKYVYI